MAQDGGVTSQRVERDSSGDTRALFTQPHGRPQRYSCPLRRKILAPLSPCLAVISEAALSVRDHGDVALCLGVPQGPIEIREMQNKGIISSNIKIKINT